MLPVEPFYENLLRCCLQAAGKNVDEVMQDVSYIESDAILTFLRENYDRSICKADEAVTLLNDKEKGLLALADKLDKVQRSIENREPTYDEILLKQSLLESKVSDIDNSLALAISKVSDNGDNLLRLHLASEGINSTLVSHSRALTESKTTIDTLATKLDGVKTVVDSTLTTATTTSTTASTILQDVSLLKTGVNAVSTSLASAHSRLATLLAAYDSCHSTIKQSFSDEVTRIYSLFYEQIMGWNSKIEQNILKWVDKSEQAESLRLSLTQILDQLNSRVSDLRASLIILGDINVSASKYATWVASAAAMSQLLGELTAAVGQMRDNIACILEVHKDLVKSSETANLIGAFSAAANVAQAGGVIADSVTNASRLKHEEEKRW